MNEMPEKRYWLFSVLPLVLGLLSVVLISQSDLLGMVFYVRADLRVLILLLSFLIFFLICFLGGWRFINQKHGQTLRLVQIQANEDKRRFLQRLDHELKNPLMAIRAGLANFADAPSALARNDALSSVEAQTVRLSRLTADLRKVAELETRPLERSSIDLTQLLEEAIYLVKDRPGAENRNLTLIVPQAPWPLSTISGDRDLIFLAVYNLLENALKFTGQEETIEIRGREDGRYIFIDVADTGPGIEPSELPHVWEELYRGQGARGIPGSGLGLALVKAVIERHSGSVALHSRVGQGTVVTLKLPIA